jgi:G:T-mismatch repair DNA endonuclease (very short patch repair protein)
MRRLRRLGWRVLTIWECQTRDPARLKARIARFLFGRRKIRAHRRGAEHAEK